MAPKRKKPPTPTLEQEAKSFIKSKEITKSVPEKLSPHREQLAASVLAGLLVSGRSIRAEELVEEAYRYVDLLLQYNK
tara:strand:- start:1871 stop:2104 length:234 start_codon:yes stop_codon:yes gene_type:complete